MEKLYFRTESGHVKYLDNFLEQAYEIVRLKDYTYGNFNNHMLLIVGNVCKELKSKFDVEELILHCYTQYKSLYPVFVKTFSNLDCEYELCTLVSKNYVKLKQSK